MAAPATSAQTWQPSAPAIYASHLATTGRYDEPPPWNGGLSCAGSQQPGTRALGQAVLAYWPGIVTSVGGYNCRANTANPNALSLHGTGRADDLMLAPAYRGDVSRVVDGIADWLLLHAGELGIQEVIWSNTIWTSLRGLRPYVGEGYNPHCDHIHVGLSVASARQLPPVPAGVRLDLVQGGTGSARSIAAVLGAALGAGVAIAVGVWATSTR